MKLNNYLIITLPDFARYFTFTEFWEKRQQFVRDMHPDKVYYWNDKLKDAYNSIATWVCEGDSASDAVKENGIHALETIINREIAKEEIFVCNGEIDFTSAIIKVQAGTTLELPQYDASAANNNAEINLCFHKIEVHGDPNRKSIIKIGTRDSVELYGSEFTYVTEVNNQFIEFMPTYLENDVYKLHLTSQEDVFASDLNVTEKEYGNVRLRKGVISFAVTNDGYIFINSNCRAIIMTKNSTELSLMLRLDDRDAFYVKARNNQVVILCKDGTVRSTSDENMTNKVVFADVQ